MKTTEEILQDHGYLFPRQITGRGWCALMPMCFTVGLFFGLDEVGYYGRFCYPTFNEALQAFVAWDGKEDPPGNWIKYKGRGGEYSNPKTVEKKVEK